jgi:hypothetical protein
MEDGACHASCEVYVIHPISGSGSSMMSNCLCRKDDPVVFSEVEISSTPEIPLLDLGFCSGVVDRYLPDLRRHAKARARMAIDFGMLDDIRAGA